ncbi:MAG: hypothetical protein U9P07_04280 [Pseudomonadota bacterium]|nr:hypothetical protein [Pseudomonadota bacterium]
MVKTVPSQLILRSYGYYNDKKWIGLCIDFDIAVQAHTEAELKKKMQDAIKSYIETVLNTDNKESISELLNRKAPPLSIIKFHLISALMEFRHLRRKFFTFDEVLPFHLSSSCSC